MSIHSSPLDSGQPRALAFLVAVALVVGCVAGFGAFVFRQLIGLFHNLSFRQLFSSLYDANQHTAGTAPVWLPLVALPSGALVVTWLVRNFAPEAKGHGVPEVLDAVHCKNGHIRPIVVLIKALASSITIGSGGSAGREGPIVQIGAAFGSFMGGLLRLDHSDRVTLLAAGGNHSCLVHTDGTLRCWGYNLYGQLGDGGDINRLIPVRAFAAGREVSEVALGEVHSCAIFRQGRVRCWGRNALGHLGDGSTADNWTGATPQLPGNYWWAVASFGDGSCAQGYNGEIRCWGYDAYGQAGDGDRGGSELVPVLVSGGVITWPRASAYVWHRVPGGWTPGLRRVRATYAGSATLAASVSNRVDHTTVP